MSKQPEVTLPNVNITAKQTFGSADISSFDRTIQKGYPLRDNENTEDVDSSSDWNMHIAIALVALVVLVNITLAMVFGVDKQVEKKLSPNAETTLIEVDKSLAKPNEFVSEQVDEPITKTAITEVDNIKKQMIINKDVFEKLKKVPDTESLPPKKPALPLVEATNFIVPTDIKPIEPPSNKVDIEKFVESNGRSSKLLSIKNRQEILNQLSQSPHDE